MGRIEELRAKLLAKHEAQKPPPEVRRFIDQLNAHLQATQGFFVHTRNTWALALFEKSKCVAEASAPAWIAAQTANLFRSVGKPPR